MTFKFQNMYKYFIINNTLVPIIGGGMSTDAGALIVGDYDSSKASDSSSSRNTDILFTQIALGEGPVYRINPNGPQDIEIDNKFIDDLVDFSTNTTKNDVFATIASTGTILPTSMSSFFKEKPNSVRLASRVTLKSGNVSGGVQTLPRSVQFYPTSVYSTADQIHSIRFKFNITDLKSQSSDGVNPNTVDILAIIHPYAETSNTANYINIGQLNLSAIVDGELPVDLDVPIPSDKKSVDGYRVSVFKTSLDVNEVKYGDSVTLTETSEIDFIGFDEIIESQQAYPRTAVVGYAIKSNDFRNGSGVNYTTAVKGLICDVPSNYNQPINFDGEVDWRNVEIPPTGPLSITSTGHYGEGTQRILTYSNPIIYNRIWDGTYKKNWTENYVWIIKALLTDPNIGLGLPDSIIDRYNFYTTAQYCDGVNPITGAFVGVPGFADGSFRYKPLGYLPSIEDTLVGLPEGTPIMERRFVCGLSITDSSNVLELIQTLAASFRAVLTIRGNKLAFTIDKEGLYPEAYFNETNIQQDSFKISGVREEDLINGVEISYIDFIDHFNKKTVVLDATDAELEIPKRVAIEAVGCTRKGQALRLGKYLLESSRNQRRKIQFSSSMEASDVSVGQIIGVSQRANGLTYGFGGIIANDTVAATSNVYLEHLTSPAISSTFFTNNTFPIALKVFQQSTNSINHYIVSNNATITTSTNGSTNIRLSVLSKFDYAQGVYFEYLSYDSVRAPKTNDLWALGYINPSNIYSSTAEKLFRVDTVSISNGLTNIAASEYNSDILALADNSIKYISMASSKNLNFTSPPIPLVNLNSIPSRAADGSVSYNLLVSNKTDTSNYSVPVGTVLEYAKLNNVYEVKIQRGS